MLLRKRKIFLYLLFLDVVVTNLKFLQKSELLSTFSAFRSKKALLGCHVLDKAWSRFTVLCDKWVIHLFYYNNQLGLEELHILSIFCLKVTFSSKNTPNVPKMRPRRQYFTMTSFKFLFFSALFLHCFFPRNLLTFFP